MLDGAVNVLLIRSSDLFCISNGDHFQCIESWKRGAQGEGGGGMMGISGNDEDAVKMS